MSNNVPLLGIPDTSDIEPRSVVGDALQQYDTLADAPGGIVTPITINRTIARATINGGGIILLPPHPYVHNATVTVTQRNIHIKGRPGTVVLGVGPITLFHILADDCSVSDTEFDGSGGGQIAIAAPDYHAPVYTPVKRCRIERNYIHDFTFYPAGGATPGANGILSFSSESLSVIDNVVDGVTANFPTMSRGSGISVAGATNYTIRGNKVSHCEEHGIFVNGIKLPGGGGYCPVSDYGTVTENIIHDTGGCGLALEVGRYTVVANNNVRRAGRWPGGDTTIHYMHGISLSRNDGGVSDPGSNYNMVVNNYIEDCAGDAITCESVFGLTVANNVGRNCSRQPGDVVSATSCGLRLWHTGAGAMYSVVANNRFEGNEANGIDASDNNHYTIISNNLLANNGVRGAYTVGRGCTVTGNIFTGNGASGTAGAYTIGCGLWLRDSHDSTVTGNVFFDNVGPGLYNMSTKRATITGNSSFDTRAGGARTQTNGVIFDTSDGVCTGCSVNGNNCYNNVTANYSGLPVGADIAISKLASLGVNNAAAASVIPVANLVKKVEIFDDDGTSLGYVPVYSAIP